MFTRSPDTWTRLAAEVRAAAEALAANQGDQQRSSAYRELIETIFSTEWHAMLEELKESESAESIDACIDFLVADPMCFRSGYEKEKVCRLLSHISLSRAQKKCLQPAVERVLQGAPRVGRELKRWQQLEKSLQDEQKHS